MRGSHETLETDRFSLIPMRQGDAYLLANMGADPDVVKNLICD